MSDIQLKQENCVANMLYFNIPILGVDHLLELYHCEDICQQAIIFGRK